MPRKKKSSTPARKPSSNLIDWSRRARKIRKFRSLPTRAKVNFTPQEKQIIYKLWEKYKWLRADNIRKVGRKQRRELRAAGFEVEQKGAIIEHMTGPGNKKIPGARLKVSKTGTVVQFIKKRVDYYIPINGREREKFIIDPDGYVRRKSKENKIPPRRWVNLIVNGSSWGRLTASGAAIRLQSFRAKNPDGYKKAKIALKFISFKETRKHGKKKTARKKRKTPGRRI